MNLIRKINKRIIWVSIFLFTFLLWGHSVFAAEIKYCKDSDKKPDEEDITNRFGVKITHVSGMTFRVSMTNCDENVEFTIKRIDDDTTNAAVGKVLNCNNPITYTTSGGYESRAYGLPATSVTLESTGPVKSTNANGCYWKSVEVSSEEPLDGQEEVITYPITVPPVVSPTMESSVINCDNNTYIKGGQTHAIVAGSFEDKFCNAKRKAIAAGKAFDFGDGKYQSGSVESFKCETDFNAHPELVPHNPDELTGDDYFVNKKYLYGESKMSDEVTIYYHVTPDGYKPSKKLECEITCQEAVEVEYGPPVAAAAGVCYEYKVRVTSRVACNLSKITGKEEVCESDYCTPYPHCVHNGGKVYTQGGPSEDFDACIMQCDGGNYTKKCNNKCYKEVYGTASAYAKVESAYHDDVFATKVAMSGTNFTCGGYYTKASQEGEITWKGNPKDSAGRWYCSHHWSPVHGKSTYYTDGHGFFRGNYGRCNDTCSWRDCTGKYQYLNKCLPQSHSMFSQLSSISSDLRKDCANDEINVMQYDCEHNMQIYNEFVQSCQSKVSCSTETAEFTIDVDYTKADAVTPTTIKFPYKGQTDTITHNGGVVVSTQDQKNTTLIYDFPSAGEGMYGCYKRDASEIDLYRATWGFPGTWQNVKTGEFSYDYSGKTTDIWMEHPHRFCVPGDAKGVNVLWYNAFMGRVLREQNILQQTSATNTYIDANMCPYTVTTTSVTQYTTTIPEEQLTFNIKAHTRKFGYMQWNIDINCLYAVNEDPLCGNYSSDRCYESNNTIRNNCTKDGGYRVHTVDVTDMFPNEDGAELTDPTKHGRSYVGYNWSEYAVNEKNTDYKSNPPAYMAKIQGNADSVYTDKNLDYEFYLSPKTIREIRNSYSGSDANYTAFSDSGFKIDEFGLSRYQSKKIHGDSPIPSSDKKIPPMNSKAISCNNMISWNNTSACCEHTDGNC